MKILLLIFTLFLSACTTATEENLKQCRQDLYKERVAHKNTIAHLKDDAMAVAMFEYCTAFPNQRLAFLCDLDTAYNGQALIKIGSVKSNIYYKLYLFTLTILIIAIPLGVTLFILSAIANKVLNYLSLKLKLSKLESEAQKYNETIQHAKKIRDEFEDTQKSMNEDLKNLIKEIEYYELTIKNIEESIEPLNTQKEAIEEELSELEHKKSVAEEALKISDF